MEILNSSNFSNKVQESEICLVDFSASWCGPCRMVKPILEDVETFMPEIKFYNIDVDDCEDIAREYRIFSIPSLLIFKNGEVLDTMVGAGTQDDIIEFINKNR